MHNTHPVTINFRDHGGVTFFFSFLIKHLCQFFRRSRWRIFHPGAERTSHGTQSRTRKFKRNKGQTRSPARYHHPIGRRLAEPLENYSCVGGYNGAIWLPRRNHWTPSSEYLSVGNNRRPTYPSRSNFGLRRLLHVVPEAPAPDKQGNKAADEKN